MDQLTAAIRAGKPIEATSFGPDEKTGKFGVYIGVWEDRDGYRRLYSLLPCEPIHETAEAAKSAAEEMVREIRESVKG